MKDFQEYKEIESLIAQACNNFDEYHKYLIAKDNINLHLDDYGFISFEDAIMSCKQYYYMSKLIAFPEKTVVIDCGCCVGIQQVFFNKCKKYIGIDMLNNFQKISSNAEFICGDMKEVLKNIDTDKFYTIGISNMCCSYFEDTMPIFKKKFNKLISL